MNAASLSIDHRAISKSWYDCRQWYLYTCIRHSLAHQRITLSEKWLLQMSLRREWSQNLHTIPISRLTWANQQPAAVSGHRASIDYLYYVTRCANRSAVMPFDYPCASDTPRKLKSDVSRPPRDDSAGMQRRENWVTGKRKPGIPSCSRQLRSMSTDARGPIDQSTWERRRSVYQYWLLLEIRAVKPKLMKSIFSLEDRAHFRCVSKRSRDRTST